MDTLDEVDTDEEVDAELDVDTLERKCFFFFFLETCKFVVMF